MALSEDDFFRGMTALRGKSTTSISVASGTSSALPPSATSGSLPGERRSVFVGPAVTDGPPPVLPDEDEERENPTVMPRRGLVSALAMLKSKLTSLHVDGKQAPPPSYSMAAAAAASGPDTFGIAVMTPVKADDGFQYAAQSTTRAPSSSESMRAFWLKIRVYLFLINDVARAEKNLLVAMLENRAALAASFKVGRTTLTVHERHKKLLHDRRRFVMENLAKSGII